TEEICREFVRKDSRIRYYRNASNIGLYTNFNKVFRLSSGLYFRWAAADDLSERKSLGLCVDVLDKHPEVVLCYPKTVLIDAANNPIRSYDDNLDLRFPSPASRFKMVLKNLRLTNVHYGLIRADVLRRTSLFGDCPGADMILIAELALYG